MNSTKMRILGTSALVALLLSSPALAQHKDHSGSGQPDASSGSGTSGSSGASGSSGSGASGGSGAPHQHGRGGSGAPTGNGSSGTGSGGSGAAGGASSGSGVTVTTGGGSGSGSSGGSHHHDRSGFGGGTPSSGGAGGSSGGSPGGSAIINNPYAGHSGTGGSNAMGGSGRDHGTRFNNGVTVIAPRTHWGHPGSHHDFFFQFRRIVNANHRFHHGNYIRPNGWYAHSWRYGEFLPYVFFAQQYWIDDWQDFDLDEPPPGTVWVRYGSDALLIDEDTGEVIEVIYGLFY